VPVSNNSNSKTAAAEAAAAGLTCGFVACWDVCRWKDTYQTAAAAAAAVAAVG
jgi:hypothetical protein